MDINSKKKIVKNGVIYFITEAFPPVLSGSSIVNYNLLSYFTHESYVVFMPKTKFKRKMTAKSEAKVKYIAFSFEHISSKLHRWLLPIQLNFSKYLILFLSKFDNPQAIVVTYPSLFYLEIGIYVAQKLNLPLIPYLHDTIVEALAGSSLEKKSNEIQKKLWKSSSKIFVMSRGMKDLYKRKYNIECDTLIHSNVEYIMDKENLKTINTMTPKCFWAGDIYNINNRALVRIVKVLNEIGGRVEFTSPKTKVELINMGIELNLNSINFYENRTEYLSALGQSDILILALNWQEESSIHHDELETIFPTKTPEYLASGKLIIVHAPESYFISRFFYENRCGIVITNPEPHKIKEKLTKILNRPELLYEYQRNALYTARMFNIKYVADIFSEKINDVISDD